MKIDELIRKIRADMNAQISIRNDLTTELATLRGADEIDEAKVTAKREERGRVDATLADLRAKLAQAEVERSEDEDVEREQARAIAAGTGEDTTERGALNRLEVTEKRTYSPDNDPHGVTFARDVVLAALGNSVSQSKLARHMDEERAERGADAISRATVTGSTPGLVIPQYLTDFYQPKGRPGRHLADQMTKHNLPEKGMVVHIPRQTVQTEVDEQVDELDPVTDTEYEDELIDVRIRTAAGSATLARQAVDRGEGVDDVVLKDLFKAYDQNLDSKLINTPTRGLLAVANTVTYTDASATAPELYRKILEASANIEDVLQDIDPDDVFTLMRGRRWAWLRGELTDKWPFIAAQGIPALAGGVSNGTSYAEGVRGFLPDGGPVVTDNNLPNNLGTGTNEDVIPVVARSEAHLWEDPSAPLYIRTDTGPNMKNLGIDLVVYGYFAFCFDRVVDSQGTPKAVHQKITGTGLVPAVF